MSIFFELYEVYCFFKNFDYNKVIKFVCGRRFTNEKAETIITYLSIVSVFNFTCCHPGYGNNYRFCRHCQELTIYTGKSVLLKVNGTSGKVKWISQNKRIVTVDSKGKVTARGVGKTIIFAKTGNYTLRCQITVKKKVASRPQVQSSVWIPATGKKYHRIPNCGNMNPNRAHKVTLSQAKQRGYTACKNCYR